VTVLDRVPVDEITARARQVNLGRVLLGLIAGFFWLAGWAAGRLSLAVIWCVLAVKVGWEAGRSRGGPAGTG
jgi:hypothetical protein